MAQDTASWDRLSTGLALGLGGAAVATTALKSDMPGFREGAKTAGATLLAVEALKFLVSEQRPDGSNDKSLPSGHTALAFSAATYFDIRYGDEYKPFVPVMYGLAALTGLARVQAKKHHAWDVAAGAVIGWGMARVFTTPINSEFAVAPTADGVKFSFTRKF
ncbi:MAG: phosphatase PAP2 family protein [Marinibacterium sp.]